MPKPHFKSRAMGEFLRRQAMYAFGTIPNFYKAYVRNCEAYGKKPLSEAHICYRVMSGERFPMGDNLFYICDTLGIDAEDVLALAEVLVKEESK